MKKFYLFIVLVLFMLINACGNKPGAEQESQKVSKEVVKIIRAENGWKYRDTLEYSIQYPEGWEFKTTGGMGIEFIVLSTAENKTDSFRENINLTVEELPQIDATLANYAAVTEEHIKTFIKNVRIVDSETVGDGADEYHKLVYEGKQGKKDLTYEQYIRVKENKAYVLTFTSKRNEYENYKSIAEKIMCSFRIK